MSSPPEDDVTAPVDELAPALADSDDAPGEDGPAAEGEGGGEARRGRRRNRRNRKRGDGEGAAAAGDGAAGAEPPQADALFEQVVSGAFDVEEAPEAAAPAAAEPEAEAEHKRVLAAEPDAPKLHKVLAQAGIGSRREMEQMILDGRITVNGEPAHIGQRISFGDQVKVGGKPIRFRIVPPPPRVIAYHKPVGEIVTHDDPQNRPTVFRRLPRLAQGKWQSVGRLDINTEGLLLFTNSGGLANQLMHPRFGVEREYAVRVLGTLSEESREKLLAGIEIDGQSCAFKAIHDGGGDGANRWYRVVITEGRNREVRKLFDAVGLAVSRLIRIRYGTVVLPHGLKRGMWVDLGESDVRAIRRLAGGAGQGEGRQQPPQDRGESAEGGNGKRRRRGRGGRSEDDRPPRDVQPGGDAFAHEARERPRDDDDFDADLDEHGPIPNPLEQTFDKRFVQKPRSTIGGRGFKHGGGGFGPGGSSPPTSRNKGGGSAGPRQPDPMQTSVGYIGADAFHRKNRGGGRGGRGGGGGGGGGGFGGGFGGGGRGR